MPHQSPEAGCYDIFFDTAYSLSEEAEVALEDYARALTRGTQAAAVRASDNPGAVRGVHVCGLGVSVTPTLLRDLEDFARSLGTGTGGGLGWS